MRGHISYESENTLTFVDIPATTPHRATAYNQKKPRPKTIGQMSANHQKPTRKGLTPFDIVAPTLTLPTPSQPSPLLDDSSRTVQAFKCKSEDTATISAVP